MSHDPGGTGPRTKRSSAASEDAVHEGGCHCGFVRFAVQAHPRAALVCNCSICTMKGTLHWVVPRSRFRLLSPADEAALPVYRFGTRVAAHYFCPVCGVSAFYVPRSDPDKIDVNLRCVNDIDVSLLPVEEFEGRDWDEAIKTYRRDPDEE
jgi:centromere protein V